MTETGTEYLGSQSYTASGEQCINWTLTRYPDVEGNLCRNPDSRESGLFCVTADFKEESCHIPFCKRKYQE